MQKEQSAAQTVESLLGQERQVAAQIADTQEQLENLKEARRNIRSALEGVKLGQQFAAERAAVEAPAPEAD